jgi:hypothetical protein
MSIYVDFNWSVHANHSHPSDNLRRFGDLLRPEEEFVIVAIPTIVETLEAIRRKAD